MVWIVWSLCDLHLEYFRVRPSFAVDRDESHWFVRQAANLDSFDSDVPHELL